MFDFLQNKEYLRTRNEEEWFYFGKVDVPLPSWGEILNEFDRIYRHCVENTIEIKNMIENYPNFSTAVWTDGIEIAEKFRIEIQNSHDIRANQNFTSQFFLSMTSLDSMFGKHKDSMDVWIWQIQGSSFWEIEGKKNFTKKVTPGDLIYIPRGTYHTITPLEPRVSISFASENQTIG